MYSRFSLTPLVMRLGWACLARDTPIRKTDRLQDIRVRPSPERHKHLDLKLNIGSHMSDLTSHPLMSISPCMYSLLLPNLVHFYGFLGTYFLDLDIKKVKEF